MARWFSVPAMLASALLWCGCAARHVDTALTPLAPSGTFGERIRVVALDSGVTATIVAPARLDTHKRIDMILYALPNGNSTAETIGRRLGDGVGWRFDIQHIGAQTRALRARGVDQAVVIYLETDTKSWPTWRAQRGYDRANTRIVAMVDTLRRMLGNSPRLVTTMTGHSGGGSFMFGFIEGQAQLPAWLERIAFLDANYNFDVRHLDKLTAWLNRDTTHTLVAVAYDDREIMLDGKKVVSDSGGTWRASQRMIQQLELSRDLRSDSLGVFRRFHDAQIEIVLHPNPQNRILHTELVGEMNGYMHALLLRRPGYTQSVLTPTRAYVQWIEPPR